MNKPRLEEELDHVEAYAQQMISAIRVLSEHRYILEPLVNDRVIKEALSERLDNTHAARAYNRLFLLVGHDMVKDIYRAFLDHQDKVASMRNLYRKIRNPRILCGLRDRYADVPRNRDLVTDADSTLTPEQLNEIHQNLVERDCEQYGDDFDELWQKVDSDIEALTTEQVAGSIATFRNTYVAHLQMQALGEGAKLKVENGTEITFEEMFDFCERAVSVAFELALLVKRESYDVEGFNGIHQKAGEEMWRIFAGLQ